METGVVGLSSFFVLLIALRVGVNVRQKAFSLFDGQYNYPAQSFLLRNENHFIPWCKIELFANFLGSDKKIGVLTKMMSSPLYLRLWKNKNRESAERQEKP